MKEELGLGPKTWAPSRSTEKKLAAFSALGGRFLQFPIGDRRCNRTRASVGNAGGNARPSLTNATLAASRLLCAGALSGGLVAGLDVGPRRGLWLPAWPRLGHNFAN